jgi:hypothetical protein
MLADALDLKQQTTSGGGRCVRADVFLHCTIARGAWNKGYMDRDR